MPSRVMIFLISVKSHAHPHVLEFHVYMLSLIISGYLLKLLSAPSSNASILYPAKVGSSAFIFLTLVVLKLRDPTHTFDSIIKPVETTSIDL